MTPHPEDRWIHSSQYLVRLQFVSSQIANKRDCYDTGGCTIILQYRRVLVFLPAGR